NALTCAATISGLTNGSTTTLYVRANSLDALGDSHDTTTNQTVTISVLAGAGADTTAPSTIAGLEATLLGSSQVRLDWGAGTDNVAIADYQIYQSTDACVTPVLAATATATSVTLSNLPPSTTLCWEIKARDTSSNLSAVFSNTVSLTMPSVLDVQAPTQVTGLTLLAYRNSFVMAWNDA